MHWRDWLTRHSAMISVVRLMINVQQYREFNWGPVCHSIVGGQAYRHPVSDVVAVTHRTLSLTGFPFMKLRVAVTNCLLAETGHWQPRWGLRWK